MPLAVNDKAPNFKGVDQNGEELSLAQYADKKLILFFYPKDNTPGCTKESCNLRDNYTELKERGFEVVGVSADSEKSHVKFIDKFDLPYRLLADTEREVIEAFDVWKPKKFMGREFLGIVRTTFIIENGVITHVFEKVKTADHTAQILTELDKK